MIRGTACRPSTAPAGNPAFPPSFTLAGVMNPCPCGYHGDPSPDCACGSSASGCYYQRGISGPLPDRIDILSARSFHRVLKLGGAIADL
ncbi:MAG: ATP-binding protein [Dehalococcoidia bacterium]|nr:ATP-binding protein [Dehalococcoidia bacterium]